jgi:hypothetical protein
MPTIMVDHSEPALGWNELDLGDDFDSEVRHARLKRDGDHAVWYFQGLVRIWYGTYEPDGTVNTSHPVRIIVPETDALHCLGLVYRQALSNLLGEDLMASFYPHDNRMVQQEVTLDQLDAIAVTIREDVALGI